MTVPVRVPLLARQDTVVLGLLRLAAEAILAHPRAVPPDLYEMCDSWADELAAALSAPGTEPADAGVTHAVSGQPAAKAVTPGTAWMTLPASRTAGSGLAAAGQEDRL